MVDTNIFMKDYKCLEKLLDGGTNEVVVCSTVLQELDNHKGDSGINGYNVRKSIRWMRENKEKFEFDNSDSYDSKNNDDKILDSARIRDCILITDDLCATLKAGARKIDCEDYKEVGNKTLGELRKGKHIIKNDHKYLSEVYSGNAKPREGMYANDFVLFQDNEDVKDIFQVKGGKLVKANLYDKSFSGATPRNLEQKLALTLLADKELEMVNFTGTFGSAKSFLQIGMALELVTKGVYDKIYIAKAPISLDKNLETGFKPGTALEKMELTLGSVTTNLKKLHGNNNFNKNYTGFRILEDYIERGVIEVLSIEQILGSSLMENSILLIEEIQLLTPKVCRAVLSRVSDGSVIFTNSDLKQCASNNLLPEETGVFKLIEAFAGYDKSAHLTLENVVRSNFVAELDKRWLF